MDVALALMAIAGTAILASSLRILREYERGWTECGVETAR